MIPPNIAHSNAHVESKAANLGDLLRLYRSLPKNKGTVQMRTPFQIYYHKMGHNVHWHVLMGLGLVGYTLHHFRHKNKH